MIEALFKDTHEALTFAFNFSEQQYARTPMSRVILPPVPGKGLGGLDGAAQAGMIKQEVEQLDRLEQAFIVARFASVSIPCDCGRPCCSGKRSNDEWTHAVGVLSLHLKEVVLLGCSTTIDMRIDYLNRFFLPKNQCIGMSALARKHHANVRSMERHLAKVKKFISGLEERAMTAITDRLEQARIIGRTE